MTLPGGLLCCPHLPCAALDSHVLPTGVSIPTGCPSVHPSCRFRTRNGVAYEMLPHHQWMRDKTLFNVLTKLMFFKKYWLFMVRRRAG